MSSTHWLSVVISGFRCMFAAQHKQQQPWLTIGDRSQSNHIPEYQTGTVSLSCDLKTIHIQPSLHVLLFLISSQTFYMHHPRTVLNTTFVTPVVRHWLEQEIA